MFDSSVCCSIFSKEMERPKNPLLLPKWKKRTVDTHLEHIKLYNSKEYQFAFLGDSMMERWFRTGANIWNKHFDKRVCNLGVGGDGVQNLLLRLQGFEQDQEHVKGIFDFVNITNTVFLMIGKLFYNIRNKTLKR